MSSPRCCLSGPSMPSTTSSSTLSEKSWWLASCMTMKHFRLRARFPRRAPSKVTVPSHRLRPHTASAKVDFPAPHAPTKRRDASDGKLEAGDFEGFLEDSVFPAVCRQVLEAHHVFSERRLLRIGHRWNATATAVSEGVVDASRAQPSRMRSASSRRANSSAVHRRARRPLSR